MTNERIITPEEADDILWFVTGCRFGEENCNHKDCKDCPNDES